MSGVGVDLLRIAELEARIAALEELLEAKSEVLRRLQRHLSAPDLASLEEDAAGDQGAHGLDLIASPESTALTSAEVEETLVELWTRLERRAVHSAGDES